jgi:hypothetical protein
MTMNDGKSMPNGSDPDEHVCGAATQPRKRTYVGPNLRVYGSVKKLTAGGGTKTNDSGPRTQA